MKKYARVIEGKVNDTIDFLTEWEELGLSLVDVLAEEIAKLYIECPLSIEQSWKYDYTTKTFSEPDPIPEPVEPTPPAEENEAV